MKLANSLITDNLSLSMDQSGPTLDGLMDSFPTDSELGILGLPKIEKAEIISVNRRLLNEGSLIIRVNNTREELSMREIKELCVGGKDVSSRITKAFINIKIAEIRN